MRSRTRGIPLISEKSTVTCDPSGLTVANFVRGPLRTVTCDTPAGCVVTLPQISSLYDDCQINCIPTVLACISACAVCKRTIVYGYSVLARRRFEESRFARTCKIFKKRKYVTNTKSNINARIRFYFLSAKQSLISRDNTKTNSR